MIDLNEIESKYFNLLEGYSTISEFENWVYESNKLEELLSESEYTEIISLNYNTPSAKYEVGKILTERISFGRIETFKMVKLLNSIIDRDGKEADALREMYHLYCNGYYFLEGLGLGLGLCIEVPNKYNAEYYEQLNDNQKLEIVDSVYPEAKMLAKELKKWLLSDEIKLTGTKEPDLNRWDYIDQRSKEDMKSRVWEVNEVDTKTGKVKSKRNKVLISKNQNKNKEV